MKPSPYKKNRYWLLVAFAIILTIAGQHCSKKKNLLKESANLKLAEVSQKESLRLKRECKPVGFKRSINDKTALVEAVTLRADTVQVFNSREVGGLLTGQEDQMDIRFWQCSGSQEIKQQISLVNSSTGPDSKAVVFIADFINATSEQSQNYDWLSTSLPAAIEAAMKRSFDYTSAQNDKNRKKFNSLIQGRQLPAQTRVNMVAGSNNLDIIVYGKYAFDQAHNQLLIQTRVFSKKTGSQIATIEEKAGLNNSIFLTTRDLTDKIIREIYKAELNS